MRIIIVGCGKVGKTIAGELSQEKHDVTVIDSSQDAIDDVTTEYDVMGVVGNGASYSVQKEAGIDNSDLLIAVTESDEINLLCCLFAKKAGLRSTIARVRNPQYRNEVAFIKEELGLSMAVNPEFDAATEIARVLRFPTVNKIDTFAKGRVELLRFTIPEGSVLANHTLIEISKMTRSEVLICAVIRGDEEVTIPKGNFVLKEKDTICIIAGPLAAKEFFKRIGHDTHQVKDTMIVGGGRVAYYLAEQLIKMGIAVKIIERDRDRCQVLSELLPKASIINGDSNNQDVLLEEGIEKAEAFVSLTGIDEGNVFLSLFAKKYSKAKVVTKINRLDYDDIINTFNLGSIVSPKSITADYILSYVRAKQNSIGSNVETLYKIIENKVEALEFKVTENIPQTGIPLQSLQIKENILVGCVNRNGKVQIANGQTTIEVGDTVIVITTQTGLHDLKDIFKNG